MKTFLLFLFILIISLNFIYAVPELPMIVSGEVYINDKPAKVGTEISTFVNGEELEKVEVSDKGKFNLLLQKLNEGDEVRFFVDSIDAEQSIFYKSGDFKQLTLKVEKSYLIYYLSGGIIALAVSLIIWRQKSKKK